MQFEGSFVIFWLTYLLTLSIGIMLAYLVAIVSPNMDVANAALPTYVVRICYSYICYSYMISCVPHVG